ncbi:hypothetical protein O181_011478 [Austropuccinia psidii MF-1]|uniref:Uncharacterized protein n=1 Tax=Austropuccinia psidii MF-1 TaxID=1389203 RepID=A0A9Q3BVD2_9BASI|nr:hypothetical protein [Austropuccinia psidii MF-1]
MLVMLTNKHTKNACLLCNTFNHAARGVPAQEALVRNLPLSTMMKAFPSRNGCRNTKQADNYPEQNTPNPVQQDSPFPCVPFKQTPWQPTPGLSGTQCELTLPPFVEPSQYNEPPIPGSSQSSESQLPSHEDTSACEPEPEVAPMQSMEDPFAHSTTPCSIIMLDNTPVGSPPPLSPWFLPLRTQLSPPLIPMMRLNRNSLTCNQP